MAYQNHKHHYGRWYPSNEYQANEPLHHNKGHVAYYQEPIAEEVEAYSKAREPEIEEETTVQRYQRARHGDHHAFESVDQEADAFIQIEHTRIEYSQLMSSRAP